MMVGNASPIARDVEEEKAGAVVVEEGRRTRRSSASDEISDFLLTITIVSSPRQRLTATVVRREDRHGRTFLLTPNLAKGRRVYNEELVIREGVEFRTWDPFRSKLAAAILKGLPDGVIREGDRVLYLGTSTGTTPSHVSDIVGEKGLVIGVEFAPRVAREFVENVARQRRNVIPYVADARDPSKYNISKVDLVYCDIAQPDQTEIAVENCNAMLKPGGTLLLVVKARSIDVLREPTEIFAEERRKLEGAGFSVKATLELAPFDKDHALIWATGR